ncbi:SDR family NAD(P)-dependent oxidoreductase [Arthrobacter sp. GCM10027362]|uniref:SDR family NAD(P)-dependent oxidoreductase n=1 Tax=Arthrobacter sp. GCM10027362 TaxID=3273379 RepID=UPI00362D5D21
MTTPGTRIEISSRQAPETYRGVVVTGAARGLGKAIAQRLAAEGAAVVAVDTSAETLDETVTGLGSGHAAVVGDAGDPDTLAAAIVEAERLGGGLKTFVANAGIARPGDSLDFAHEDWDRVLNVNLRAAFIGAQIAGKHMREGGSIVMLSSICATEGFAARAAYCASKAGVEGLVRSLATEWGPRGIRVNAVAPGTISTEMQASMVASGLVSLDIYMERIPMDRIGRPEEIADAVEYLASDRASYITGVVLPVDGGWSGSGLRIPGA